VFEKVGRGLLTIPFKHSLSIYITESSVETAVRRKSLMRNEDSCPKAERVAGQPKRWIARMPAFAQGYGA